MGMINDLVVRGFGCTAHHSRVEELRLAFCNRIGNRVLPGVRPAS